MSDGFFMTSTKNEWYEFKSDNNTVPLNEWTHFALELAYSGGNAVFTLYVNGKEAGSFSKTKRSSIMSLYRIYIGGHAYWGDFSFIGQLSDYRLSRGQLDPSEFLCATAPTPETPSNVAYWKLDNGDTTVSSGAEGYLFYDGGASGSSARARGRLPEWVTGLPAGNNGSIVVPAGGTFAADYVGAKLGFGSSWSVEGWYRPSSASAKDLVCRTTDAASGAGWSLSLDASGATPSFAFRATAGTVYSPFADGTFSAAGFNASDWNHLLLTHDGASWTLYVNGASAGTVAPVWRNAALGTEAQNLTLGGGSFDMWRVVKGLVTPDKSFYCERPGLSIIVR